MARDAMKSETHSAIKSTYKKTKDDPHLKKKTNCETCKTEIAQFATNRLGNTTERKWCTPCWRKNRAKEKKQDKPDNLGSNSLRCS